MPAAAPSPSVPFDKDLVRQRMEQTRAALVSAQLNCRRAMAELAKVARFLDTRKESARLWALDADIAGRMRRLDDALQALESACDDEELQDVKHRLLVLADTRFGADPAASAPGALLN